MCINAFHIFFFYFCCIKININNRVVNLKIIIIHKLYNRHNNNLMNLYLGYYPQPETNIWVGFIYLGGVHDCVFVISVHH